MPDAMRPNPRRRGGKALRVIARVVGAIGVVVSVALAVGALVARGRVIDRVDEIAGKIDAGVAKGVGLFATVRKGVGGASARVRSLGDAARDAAREGPTDAEATLKRARALAEVAVGVQDEYREIRATYDEARAKVVSALDQLDALDEVLPAVSIPKGPREAIAALDEKVRTLDANLAELLLVSLPSEDSVPMVMVARVAERVDKTAGAIDAVSGRLGDAMARLAILRAKIAMRVDAAKRVVTWTSIALVLACLYAAFLHGVLYRSGSRPCREAAREPSANPAGVDR